MQDLKLSTIRIHLMGAPGAGITTLGKNLAQQLDYKQLDADDYHWFTTDPEPYRRRRNPDHRRKLLSEDLEKEKKWILTGSICDWGTTFAPQFQAAIFCYAPTEIRLDRIKKREMERYGTNRLTNGGDLQLVFEKFLHWAAEYDSNTERNRSHHMELDWLQQHCTCPILHLNTATSPTQSTQTVLQWLKQLHK